MWSKSCVIPTLQLVKLSPERSLPKAAWLMEAGAGIPSWKLGLLAYHCTVLHISGGSKSTEVESNMAPDALGDLGQGASSLQASVSPSVK